MHANGTAPAAAPSRDLLAWLSEVPADRIAVTAGGTSMTFGTLRAAAARVAARLAERGIGAESLVALNLPRGTDLVVALIGTLTAGAAYVPVDPRLPADRQREIVEDAAAELVIVAAEPGTPPREGPRPVPLAELTSAPAEEAGDDGYRPVPVRAENLAYVIYTSGSTGRPKGVEVTRGSVSALLHELEDCGIARPGTGRVGWNASPSFDASVQQWVRLCRGDTLVLIDEETRADPTLLARLIDESALTDLDITPSHLGPLLDVLGPLSPREGGRTEPALTLLVGGEAINPALWSRIAALVDEGRVRAVNLYGPTECTVDATAGWITSEHGPHIGTVLPGLRARLLDDTLRPVAPGEEGELYLTGSRVGRGYRGRPDLTAERFVADVEIPGQRMYRTGDRCRSLPDGRLEYLGRADGQVKLRGHRIELNEIESVLARHPGLAEVAVTYRDDLPGGAGLVAYYRAADAVAESALGTYLTERLPAYMVPSAYVQVSAFPVNANGKLDRGALPLPSAAAARAGGTRLDGPMEHLIAKVWSQVLGVAHISSDDNFFKLGGHSLLAIKLVAKVRAELGLQLPIKSVYATPRLHDLARQIDAMVQDQSVG
ncbi:non-ribosomal peptide synthetase [Streptomyces sp. FL07-04A]|uniref:non-ribosomal peptide synthetase n=1 Tax=Streptomyces sp. FL07-04A TaxID=3028658 RepID=UPI0029A924EF|nr:non-ribosomal peptide synthetase [Streptomyces sp. FL07-04A]MDX3578138.1 non-ribosomal peptide synthetase [Streptomyces sp. FL07-04A]